MIESGSEHPWVDGLTVGSVLRETARRYPAGEALVFPQIPTRMTWKELDVEVDRVASGLIQLGVEIGDHVGIWSMNTPEWVITQFAVARAGAVLVNINPAYRVHELEQALKLADVSTLIVGCSFKSSNFTEMINSLCPELEMGRSAPSKLPVLARLVAIDNVQRPGWNLWNDLRSTEFSPELAAREAGSKSRDLHNIQFTSGTTGLPKGAMLSHRNVLLNAYYVGMRLRYTERDRVCVPVPFYHCFGCVLGTLVCVVYGSTIVVPAPTFDARATLSAVEGERCTSLYGVPTMFMGQVNHPDRPDFDLSSLRTGIMAGSPCPLPLMKAVIHDLGAHQMTIGYGQTEASPIITMTSVDDPIDVRVGTVGHPLPGIEVRIVEPLSRREAEVGTAGELLARGHMVMLGYYKNAEATMRAVDTEGWLATGDLSRKREDGNYRIVGRCKELIIRGGENVYPPEIEEFLHHHPGIAEVAVFGLPDLKYGEVIAAWIVPKADISLDAESIRQFCQGQIAHFKIPQFIEIVPALPKTVTGKVRKHLLREEGISRFGLEESAQIDTA